jgi:hypothetical protein
MTGARDRSSVAPRLLDPILALVERIDRWRRGIVPIRPGSILGVERGVHHGNSVTLSDGTVVPRDAPVWTIHFDNARIRQLAARDSWQSAGYAAARDDLRRLAADVAALPEPERPVAFYGVTVVAALTRRVGFEVRDRPRTAWVRLEDWYLRTLLARWSRAGRGRLTRGHGALRTRETWLSTGELLRRYGEPPPL